MDQLNFYAKKEIQRDFEDSHMIMYFCSATLGINHTANSIIIFRIISFLHLTVLSNNVSDRTVKLITNEDVECELCVLRLWLNHSRRRQNKSPAQQPERQGVVSDGLHHCKFPNGGTNATREKKIILGAHLVIVHLKKKYCTFTIQKLMYTTRPWVTSSGSCVGHIRLVYSDDSVWDLLSGLEFQIWIRSCSCGAGYFSKDFWVTLPFTVLLPMYILCTYYSNCIYLVNWVLNLNLTLTLVLALY